MRALVVAAIALAIAGRSTDASANYNAARQLLADGLRHYEAKDFGEALDHFERAYVAYPDVGLLLNIGTTQQQLGRIADAANTYQRYVDDPAAVNVRATEARQRLAMLDLQVGRLAITVSEDPDLRASVQIGDGPWRAGVRLVRVAPGTYVVRARLDDGEEAASGEATGRIAAGEQQAIALVLTRAPALAKIVLPPAPRELDHAAPPARTPARTRSLRAYAATAVGVVALGTGAVLALRSRSRFASASSECGGDPVCGDGDIDRARSLAAGARSDRAWAIGLGAGGAAVLATGVVWWLLDARTPTRARIGASAGAGEFTVHVGGTL